METHVYRYSPYDLKVEFYNVIKWPSEDTDHFRKKHVSVMAHTIFNTFTLIGQATFRTAFNVM